MSTRIFLAFILVLMVVTAAPAQAQVDASDAVAVRGAAVEPDPAQAVSLNPACSDPLAVSSSGKGKVSGRSWTEFLQQDGVGSLAESGCYCTGHCTLFDCECDSCSLDCGLWECHECCNTGCRINCQVM